MFPDLRPNTSGLGVVFERIHKSKAHDEHVSTFFHRHVFITPVSMPSSIREARSKVMHAVIIPRNNVSVQSTDSQANLRILAAELVLDERL